MSCFSANSTSATFAKPDPAKHVNYNLGMVLGVDDFTQEFAYLSGRDQWMVRDLIGYGTVRGLKVAVEVDAIKGPRVIVEPGVAASPRGQMICVPAAQCAYLNDWLVEHKNDLPGLLGSPLANNLPLYIVLCYRDCPTDKVPIAGEPCRSEDQLMAPSRLIDNFSLELRFKKPNQREENAVRDFVGWLRQIDISDAVLISTPLDQFLQAIRDAAKPWFASPPSSPPASPPSIPLDFMFGSPPGLLHIRSVDAPEYMRAAFRLWVTELRPKWIARWHGCAATHFAGDDAAEEECVMLAGLVVPVLQVSPGNWVVANTAVSVNEDQRPYVVHLRMIQELLLGSSARMGLAPGPPISLEMKVFNVVAAGTTTLTNLQQLVVVDTTAGNITINLPLAAGNHGRVFIIKHSVGANRCSLVRAGTDTIDGQKEVVLDALNKFVQVVANQPQGTWHIVGGN